MYMTVQQYLFSYGLILLSSALYFDILEQELIFIFGAYAALYHSVTSR